MATTLEEKTYEVINIFITRPDKAAVAKVARAGLKKGRVQAKRNVEAELIKQFNCDAATANSAALAIVNVLILEGFYWPTM